MRKLALGFLIAAPLACAQNAHRCGDFKDYKTTEVPAGPTAQGRGPAINLPAYCRVDGAIDARTGVDGQPYAIGFALALPDAWNGGFLFQGGGGLNGNVGMPLGGQAAGDTPALARGFAVVSTDAGHKGGGFDSAFMRDQQAALDFYYAAIGKVAPLAKELIAWYYGKPTAHSYYDGCSTGGREAMIMSQRYPAYFDGIISGDPAIRTGYSNLALGFIGAEFAKVSGDAAKAFSDSDRQLIVKSLLDRCDAKDGLKDGMIFDMRGCDFDPAALKCAGAKNDQCLSAAQVGALKTAFAGPKSLHGDPYYPGMVFDAGIDDNSGLPGILRGPRIPVQTGADMSRFDVDKEAARIAADAGRLLGDSTWTNLSSFAGHGGKLLFYHGLSDPWFSPLDTLQYYEQMAKDTGGSAPVTSWSRLYLVPGMGHCQGGSATLDRFDMLTAVVNWVEKGEAPDSVAATGRAFPGRSRPLCPYPQHAQYKGSGDPNDAANFTCKE
jgi:feruloyl esterase